MGVDRRPLKRAPSSDTETATAEVSRAGARIETHCNHPNPSTPPHDRAFCRESSGSRGHGKRGGIDARAGGGSRRRSWLNQASYLEVSRYTALRRASSAAQSRQQTHPTLLVPDVQVEVFFLSAAPPGETALSLSPSHASCMIHCTGRE